MKKVILFLIISLFISSCHNTIYNNEIPNLILNLSSNNYSVRMNSSDKLTEIGTEATPYLIDSLNKDPYKNTSSQSFNARWNKVNVLGRIRDRRAEDVLIDRITKDKETHVRWRSIWALSNIINSSTYEKLNEKLQSNDKFIKWNAAVALGSFKRKEAIPTLVKGLNSSDNWIKWEAIYVLGILADNSTTNDLIKMLKDSNERIRQETCLTLGKIKDKKAIPYLLNALNDQSPGVRWRASSALADLKARNSINKIKETLKKETNEIAKENLQKSLEKLNS